MVLQTAVVMNLFASPRVLRSDASHLVCAPANVPRKIGTTGSTVLDLGRFMVDVDGDGVWDTGCASCVFLSFFRIRLSRDAVVRCR
jgi:hypothetical protein